MRTARLCLALALAAAPLPAAAQKMLVRQPSTYLGYGYGNYSWNTFTGLFNGAFGASNIDLVSSVGPGGLAGYSALMLTLPNLPDAPYLLTPSETTEITTFLNGGGRLYVFGENAAWSGWNGSIANLVGGTVGGTYSGNANALFSTGILTGVSTVYYPAGGSFTSLGATGVPLFDTNVAALFGPTSNALYIVDVNLCDDSYIGQADNLKFCTNITNYLNGSLPPVGPGTTAPEPATVALMATGLALVGVVARRRRAVI